MFKSITKFLSTDRSTVTYSIASDVDVIQKAGYYETINKLTTLLAEQYAKEHGPEILKRIQEQTIDAKVIQKVVGNLRKELSTGPNA